jgi:phage terminase large subunit-like protein
VDEYAIHRSAELRNNLYTGMVNREQGLMFTISTVGADMSRPMYALEQEAMRLDDVEKPTPYLTIAKDPAAGFLFVRHGLSEGSDADIEDPAVLNGCNPASWVTAEALRRQLRSPNMREEDFRRKHLNQWVPNTGGAGLPMELWDQGTTDDTLEPGQTVVLGVDIGYRSDWSAIVAAGKRPDGKVILEAHLFEPPPGDGEELDIGVVKECVDDLVAKYQVSAVVIDPMYMLETRQAWGVRGLNVVEFQQYPSRMSAAALTFYEALRQGRILHADDPVFRWHVGNARMKDTDRGFVFDKGPDPAQKVDGLVAAVLALHVLLADQSASVYNERGFLSL